MVLHELVPEALKLLDRPQELPSVIPWSSPVIAFGDPSLCSVATLGLNPSNREFMDAQGRELTGAQRRFPTLSTFSISGWHCADHQNLAEIVASQADYFTRNPYDRWFRPLDQLIRPLGVSYYPPVGGACHLDLVPLATTRKWGSLRGEERALLLQKSGEILLRTLRTSPIDTLILNGTSVVRAFEEFACVDLNRHPAPEWTLRRSRGADVGGVSFRASITAVGGVPLGRELLVLGYNHNIQSSFGVTKAACRSISNWIMSQTGGAK